jgi:hypothetical protein
MSNVSISGAKKSLKNNNKKNNTATTTNTANNKKQYDPLFDNPMVQKARESMSEEDRKRYDKIGEEMYNTINFETGVPDETIDEVLQQLKSMLESGIHPSYLTYEEKNFLEHYTGKEWYKEYGYLENDINRVNM